jgi:hypothetical protein
MGAILRSAGFYCVQSLMKYANTGPMQYATATINKKIQILFKVKVWIKYHWEAEIVRGSTDKRTSSNPLYYVKGRPGLINSVSQHHAHLNVMLFQQTRLWSPRHASEVTKCQDNSTWPTHNVITYNVIFQHPVALVFNYMHVQLPSRVQPYLYVDMWTLCYG